MQNQEDMLRHIPDERVAAWTPMKTEQLYELLDKCDRSLSHAASEESLQHLMNLRKDLSDFIDQRMTRDGSGKDLDVFT